MKFEHIADCCLRNPIGVTGCDGDCHPHSIADSVPQGTRAGRDDRESSAFLHGLNLASREPQLDCKQAIQTAGGRVWDDEVNLDPTCRCGAQ